MKLMDLRAAIRKPGNPTMVVDLGNGVPITVAFQKTPLLEALGTAFNDERTAETGLSYDPDSCTLYVEMRVREQPVDDSEELLASFDDEDELDEPMGPVAERDPADDEDDDLL